MYLCYFFFLVILKLNKYLTLRDITSPLRNMNLNSSFVASPLARFVQSPELLQKVIEQTFLLCYGGFWARGLEYEVIDDLCYSLIVIRTLGHILCQILVAKIPIGHRGIRTPELLILSSAL